MLATKHLIRLEGNFFQTQTPQREQDENNLRHNFPYSPAMSGTTPQIASKIQGFSFDSR
jgi:hypothetical protein